MNSNTTSSETETQSWFSTDVKYQGQGHAEFDNPQGFVEGPVEIQYDETGDAHIEMPTIQNYQNRDTRVPEQEDVSGFNLQHLLTGVIPNKFGGGWRIAVPLQVNNSCSKLTVDCVDPSGLFASASIQRSYSFTKPPSLTFQSLQAEFEVNTTIPAKYWVLPLNNFIFPFSVYEHSRIPHPLRLNSNSPWIAFEYQGALAFIEPLEDYEQRKDKLKSGELTQTITAVMVGEIGENTIETDQVAQWLPSDFFAALSSLAIGIEVTVPWIEFRDETGELVKRLHFSQGRRRFAKGQATIANYNKGGIGALLTNAQHSTLFDDRRLRIAMLRLVKSGLNDMGFTLEDKFAYIFRAYEGLPHEIEAPKTKTILEKEKYDTVKTKIAEVQELIHDFSQGIQIEASDTEQEKLRKKTEQDRLNRIAGRMFMPLDIDLSFGELVVQLAQEYGMHDPEVMTQFYGSDTEWPQQLRSNYRAHVMHGRFFDFRSAQYDIHQVGINMFHLQDLLARIIFKILGYDGHYNPLVSAPSADQSLDWVTPSLGAEELGYQAP